MKIKKIIGIAAIVVLCGIAVFSGVVFHHQYQDQKNSAQQFEDLSNMITDVDKSELDKEPVPEPGEDAPVSETISEEELAAREAELAMEKYRALFDQNSDFVGWISIDDTNINYPVMWTPNNPNYYLKHSFEKEYSDYGVPYIDEDCVMGESNNYVIYGHHMKNETMFHDLCNYASKDFYDEHPIIKFDTLFGFGEYQIVAVFRFDTNNDTFRYNQFTDMDEEHFKNFMNSVHLRQLYDTGVDAEYGDHLITLSTCEYEGQAHPSFCKYYQQRYACRNRYQRTLHYCCLLGDPDCSSVNQMKDKNKEFYSGTKEEIIAKGYSPCGNCRP